jgi:hypothetical protein
MRNVTVYLRINSTLTPIEIGFFSFCNPSLAPTSTTFTRAGSVAVDIRLSVASFIQEGWRLVDVSHA